MENKARLRIVIMEDDDILSSMYDEVFTRMGFGVGIAKTGQEGLRLVKENQPDLVLLDIVMPGGDGFFVLKSIKEDPATKDLPVIMHTNLFNESDKKEALRLGAEAYVVKANVAPTQLSAIIKKHIRESKKK